jgi:hypothetical protein
VPVSEAILEKRKEEPKAPLFLCSDIALAITAALYAGGGFGQKFISDAAFVVTALILLSCSRKWVAAALLIIIGLCLYQPALMQASPLVGALLFVTDRPKHGILVLIGSTLQMIGGFNPYYIPVMLLPVIALASLNRWRPTGVVTSIPAAILLVLNFLPTAFPLVAPIGHQSFAYPYRIDVGNRVTNTDPTQTYTSFDDHGDPHNAAILVLEHDPPRGLATHNWSQKRLWCENYYFGAPLYRIAAALDGFLFSNLGCKVSDDRIRLLGEAHQSEHNSFISRRGSAVVFSDSDFLNNGAIGYQKHLNSALFEKFSLPHAILLFSALALVLALAPKAQCAILPLLIALATTVCFALHHQKIDIRISDDRHIWPHSKGVAGIGAEITADTGIKIVSKHGHAKILGVGRDASASYDGERVVVMEGGSTITIGENTYEAMDLPMGESGGILNAIPIRKKGSGESGSSIVKARDVILIGTNSARSNWKRIYDAAK